MPLTHIVLDLCTCVHSELCSLYIFRVGNIIIFYFYVKAFLRETRIIFCLVYITFTFILSPSAQRCFAPNRSRHKKMQSIVRNLRYSACGARSLRGRYIYQSQIFDMLLRGPFVFP